MMAEGVGDLDPRLSADYLLSVCDPPSDNSTPLSGFDHDLFFMAFFFLSFLSVLPFLSSLWQKETL